MVAGRPALTMHRGVGSAVMSESKLEVAERHIREGRERVAHQRATLEHLERDGHQEAAREARELLSTLEVSLRLAEEGLARGSARKLADPTEAGDDKHLFVVAPTGRIFGGFSALSDGRRSAGRVSVPDSTTRSRLTCPLRGDC